MYRKAVYLKAVRSNDEHPNLKNPSATRFVWSVPLALILLVGSACTTNADESVINEAVNDSVASSETAAGSEPETPETETTISQDDALASLPIREGERRETTGSVPHVQIDVILAPEVDAELQRRVFSLPGVENRESQISLPGARSLWLADDVELARPDVFLAGREFAHIHPDGSLHVWLPTDRAIEVVETKWGESHPWADRDDFWDGLVMVFNPETLDELDITMRLLVDAYNFVTGAALDPADFP